MRYTFHACILSLIFVLHVCLVAVKLVKNAHRSCIQLLQRYIMPPPMFFLHVNIFIFIKRLVYIYEEISIKYKNNFRSGLSYQRQVSLTMPSIDSKVLKKPQQFEERNQEKVYIFWKGDVPSPGEPYMATAGVVNGQQRVRVRQSQTCSMGVYGYVCV